MLCLCIEISQLMVKIKRQWVILFSTWIILKYTTLLELRYWTLKLKVLYSKVFQQSTHRYTSTLITMHRAFSSLISGNRYGLYLNSSTLAFSTNTLQSMILHCSISRTIARAMIYWQQQGTSVYKVLTVLHVHCSDQDSLSLRTAVNPSANSL